MRQDAMSVFFGRNRFIVVSQGGTTTQFVAKSPPRLPISIFLSEILPRDALPHLRFLEVVFPPIGKEEGSSYCPTGSPEQRDLARTLNNVKHRLDLPKLTLRVHFASGNTTRGLHASNYQRRMTGKQTVALARSSYFPILATLRRLHGLRRFFVYLPDLRSHMIPPRSDKQYAYDKRYLRYLENAWESIVKRQDIPPLGQEGYDAVAAGKLELGESHWETEHESHEMFIANGEEVPWDTFAERRGTAMAYAIVYPDESN
jgi:hypothetical protein